MVEKADGSPRICVDLTRLNKFVKRPVYPPRSPKDAVACISGKARFFTTVDAVQGYHQVPLHEDSQHLTTFVTPWGRFKFLRGTMGLNATGDEYNRRSDEAVGDLPNTVKVVDDLLVYEETFEEHVERIRNMLQQCREQQITLSREKIFLRSCTRCMGWLRHWARRNIARSGKTGSYHQIPRTNEHHRDATFHGNGGTDGGIFATHQRGSNTAETFA